jgi:putative flavoprotein involved in K+ transport
MVTQQTLSRHAATSIVEAGEAFDRQRTPARARPPERHAVVVVGGGQAGLSMGYHLKRAGVPFVILDAHAQTGDSWRTRWDTLRLFTPAYVDGLDGMPFPAPAHSFPTKDEMADYLMAYAARFELPIRHKAKVLKLARGEGGYVVETTDRRYVADQVVVALGSYQVPRVPRFASELDPAIVQLHSLDYRGPEQTGPGTTLLVGAGNSGAEIAMDLVRAGRSAMISGKTPGEIPFRAATPVGKVLTRILLRFVFHRVLTLGTPIGRKARPGFISKGTPLIRVKQRDLAAAGVELVPRVEGVENGKPRLADGRTLEVGNVIWCTGFSGGLSFVELPVFDDAGEPLQRRGVSPEPGLYFLGQHFLHAASSGMIQGVGRDARHIARVVVQYARRRAA